MKYPYKGEYNKNNSHFIVEFTAPGCGTVIETKKGGVGYAVGTHLNKWNEDHFTPIKELAFPFFITCADTHERDAAAAFLVSHGCKVHGEEAHLNGIYERSFYEDDLVLEVEKRDSFYGRTLDKGESFPFFENVKEIQEVFEEKPIEAGDWVVCIDPKGDLQRGKAYKVVKIGSTYFKIINFGPYYKERFRKAEAHEIPTLPEINGHQGSIDGDIVKYGCAEIDIKLIQMIYDVHTTEFKGNRKFIGHKMALCSHVEISVKEAEQILKVYE